MGPFDNDSALDLLDELDEDPDEAVARLRAVMGRVLDGRAGESAMDRAVAAACLVAARVEPGVTDSPDAAELLERVPFAVDEELRGLAGRVFARAFAAGDDEWRAQWEAVGALPDVEAGLAPYRRVL